MASIERLIFNHNFDEYKYQEGWTDSLKSELHINIHEDRLVNIANSNMFLDVTGTAEAPAELVGVAYKAFRNVKIIENKYAYVTLYEVSPVPGRTWICICDIQKALLDINDAWISHFCKNKDKSDHFQYIWINLTDPYIYISKTPIMAPAYEGIDAWVQISGKLNVITRTAELNLDIGFVRVNSQSQSSRSFDLVDYRTFCDAIWVQDIDWDMSDTTIWIDQKTPTNLNEMMGYSGLHSTCHSGTISLGRCHDPNNLSTYGSWSTSRSEIFSANNIIHIKVHRATFTSYID